MPVDAQYIQDLYERNVRIRLFENAHECKNYAPTSKVRLETVKLNSLEKIAANLRGKPKFAVQLKAAEARVAAQMLTLEQVQTRHELGIDWMAARQMHQTRQLGGRTAR